MRAVYKCELCEKYFDTFTASKDNACLILIAFESDDMRLLRERHFSACPKCTHYCGNGDLGLAHFVGFKMEVEEEDSTEND